MKKNSLLFIIGIILVLCLTSCSPDDPCSHRDADDSSECDLCGVPYTDACDVHRDADDDGSCDSCEASFTDACDTHRDAEDNGRCDSCGVAYTDDCDTHRDLNDDARCDKCGKDFEDGCYLHRDANDDEACDRCGKPYTDACDVHRDADDDRKCDNGGEPYTDECDFHRDTDDDERCDKCDEAHADGCDTYTDGDEDSLCDICGEDYEGSPHSPLDGKRIIFIGNSYTYYGQTVLHKTQKFLTQASRVGDKGYFYQLCRANGANVDVTNWTFGGHSLTHLFGGDCAANRGCNHVDHKAYLTDRVYDYVVIQPGSAAASSAAFLSEMDRVMSFFREANPNVKFAVLVQYSAYGKIGSVLTLAKELLDGLKTVAEMGVTVVDWGGLVMDILDGKTSVPGTEFTYDRNSFVINKEPDDGYHPNLLSGYITTLMTYCALTGAPPELQPHDFCSDVSLKPEGAESFIYNFDKFVSKYYVYNGATTNFPEIFASEKEMAGIKELVGAHLEAKAYMDYNYMGEGGASDTDDPEG
ncbi:MAG: hypothetical protein IKC32_00360 [Clostridia bacterium]|nr:hypothetical protein [Clostridia bacterium]